MRLRPLNDNIIIDPDPLEITDENPEVVRIVKEGLIQIPEQFEYAFKKASPTGRVVSWGSRCKYSYEVGERVYFRQFSGAKLNFNDKEYKVINEWDLIGKVENGSDP